MDEDTIRLHAQAHGEAVVANDLGKAASDLTDDAKGQAPAVMGKLPRPTTGADIQSVTAVGDAFVATILYSGEGASTSVESRWVEQDGRPMIASLTVV
jgi:hypothetical protein